nr:MAG: hypothetical protein [Caudoviricetes sp.]
MNIQEILSSKPHKKHHLNRYLKIINNYAENKIGEKHHICPKSKDMFPEYKCFRTNKWNLCILPPKAHRLCHLILAKVYSHSRSQSFCAVKFFKPKIPSKLYESFVLQKNKTHSENMKGENNPFYRKKHKKESKQKMGLSQFTPEERKEIINSRIFTETGKQKLKESGIKNSKNFSTPEAKSNRDKSLKKYYAEREELVCPFCGLSSKNKSNMMRYHFNNCKLKKIF